MLNVVCIIALPLSNLLRGLGQVTSLSLGFHIRDLGAETLSHRVVERLLGWEQSFLLTLRHLPVRGEWCYWYDLGLGFDHEPCSEPAFAL